MHGPVIIEAVTIEHGPPRPAKVKRLRQPAGPR